MDNNIQKQIGGRQEAKESYCRPKIGQLLVNAGLIHIDELEAFLDIQKNTNTGHIPLGQLLLASGYITGDQLDYYLHLQENVNLPSDHPLRWGQRLIELGLINDDQLKIALIEQKITGCTLREALINQNWLSEQTLDHIF